MMLNCQGQIKKHEIFFVPSRDMDDMEKKPMLIGIVDSIRNFLKKLGLD